MELLHTDTLAEARRKLLAATEEMEIDPCMVNLEEARGRISAGDLISGENIPPFDRSTMDGYALAAQESYGAGESSPVPARRSGYRPAP